MSFENAGPRIFRPKILGLMELSTVGQKLGLIIPYGKDTIVELC